MTTARDFALYFMKKNLDTVPNTFDGDMKLQKLLVFADLISLSKYGKPLFNDDIFAFRNGCVVENVRLEYSEKYSQMKKDSILFLPDFSDEEQHVLDLTVKLFGELSARELSELNHQFSFWKLAYDKGLTGTGYHDKAASIVNVADIKKEISKMDSVISALEEEEEQKQELINGIRFYYDPCEVEMTDAVMDELEEFSLDAEDNAYSVYLDDGELVVY